MWGKLPEYNRTVAQMCSYHCVRVKIFIHVHISEHVDAESVQLHA